MLAPAGAEAPAPIQVISKLLEEYPDDEDYQRAYLRLCLRLKNSPHMLEYVSRAQEYAQKLIAVNPGDSESILLYFVLRGRYADLLRQQGRKEEAAKERERTMGVLTLLSGRADFSPEVRERLIMLVMRQPAPMSEDKDRREEELRTLMHNYDAKRVESLRRRLQTMRREMERRRFRREQRSTPRYPQRRRRFPTSQPEESTKSP